MGRVISKDGTTIAFDTSGKGPGVVLVGGALSDRSAAGPLATLLAPDFTVFSYDRRGRCDSGDTSPYKVEREVEDIEALIEEAGGSAFVFGISSGAALALQAAAHLKSIKRLALYEPPYIVDDTRPPIPEDFVTQMERLLAAGCRGDVVELFMTQGVGVPAEFVAAMRQDPSWSQLESLAHTLIYDISIMGYSQPGRPLPAELTRRAASVKAPTLVMAGGASPAWLHNAAQAVAKVIPSAQTRILEGQTHAVAPDVLAPVLIEFFKTS
jgi:pimeloyl-ACP methyl ester carboxylesterase